MQTYKNLNEAFVESLKLLNKGSIVNSRGSKQREILWHSMMIEDPTALSIEVPARKFRPSYAVTEWLWYLSHNPDVSNIGKLAKIWQDIADEENRVESNYGVWIHGNINERTGLNQWEWVRDELIRDRDTRRASITINGYQHKGKNNKDYPCTQYIHFFIRDNKLHLGVHMRSNDAVFGFCNDVFTFCMYQQLMLNELNARVSGDKIELGHYYHSAGSFHIYESHFAMMDKIVSNYGANHPDSISYPDLGKYTLRDSLTLEGLQRMHVNLPYYKLTKEEINNWTEEKMELIYV
jgi:thymidylate synthase